MEENNTIIEQIKDWDKTLDLFEKELKLPDLKSPGDELELEGYLTMSVDEMRKLSQEHCAEISYRLNQYSFYLQRSYNRNLGRVKRLQSVLDGYAAGKLEQYNKYWKYEEKVHALCAEDGYAGKIKGLIRQFQNRIDRLYDLSGSLTRLSSDMKSLSYAKRGGFNG